MKKDLLILSSKKYPEELTLYDVEKAGDTINLYYSKLGGSWNQPGELGYSLTETPNHLLFQDHFTQQSYEIEFAAADSLRALLKLKDTSGETFELLERK